MFQRSLMIPVSTPIAGLKGYRYKTCTVCVSVSPPRTASGPSQRVVSICDHTGKNYMSPEDLEGILMFCGIDTDRPIQMRTSKHIGDPSFGDSQYYIQPIEGEPRNE